MLRRKDNMKTRYEVLYEKCSGDISKENMTISDDKTSEHIYFFHKEVKINKKIKNIKTDNTSKNPSLSICHDCMTIKCTKIDDKISEEEITIHIDGNMSGIYSLIIRKEYEYGNPISSEITAGGKTLSDEGLDDLVNAETYKDIVAAYNNVEKHTLLVEYGRLKEGK